ncbi:CLUMA_CG001159, isoform A [Clunio marinus]|uniref:CLUMA_CG001159, isoform A n=1 Tax=Clunio marinus TaxID=568069 RepID=A0A1J1HH75_9DIPT|nr:CLUMA_CG001159, isoform A [Clunio marinus]
MSSSVSQFISAIPESAAITTATSASPNTKSNHIYQMWNGLENDLTTNIPLNQERIHDSLCSVNDLLIHLLQPIGLWTISCINFDRYYAICSPLHYNNLFTTKKVTIFLCSGWLIIIFTISPIYLMLMISGDRHVMAVCWFRRIDMRAEWVKSFDKDFYWFEVQILLTTLLTIFLPISLIVACNIRVLTIANYQRHRIASAIYESVLSAQVAITHQKNPFPPIPNLFNQPFPLTVLYPPKPNPFEIRRNSQKAALVVMELVVSAIILYCPYYLFVIIFSFQRKNQRFATITKESESTEFMLNLIVFCVEFLLLCSPTINAFLYGFKNKTIQESIQHIWRKRKTKIELHYEIQARTPSTCGSRKASLTELTSNIPQMYQPQLKRQLSDFFFGTSTSLTSHFNDDVAFLNSHKIHRTPSDSLFNTTKGRRCSQDFHHEYLSPNFDPLGKITIPSPSPSTSPSSHFRNGLSPSTSCNGRRIGRKRATSHRTNPFIG